MKTVVFVHGTGVREEAYNASLRLVAGALSATDISVEQCFWGRECGAALFLGGASVPGFDATKAIEVDGIADSNYDVALWAMLYDDPAAELRLLALRGAGEQDFRPGGPSVGEELAERFRGFDACAPDLPDAQAKELAGLLDSALLAARIGDAQARILEMPAFIDATGAAQEPLANYWHALARALFATGLRIAWQEGDLPDGVVLLDGSGRDRLVRLIAVALGGAEKGVLDWIRERAGGLVANAGTRWFERQRGSLSGKMAPYGADVIAYQARPMPIRSYIRRTLDEVSAAARTRGRGDRLVILAHSLGGIACVEALIEAAHPAVAGIVTVGSQAPLLHEMDALASLPLPRGANGQPLGKAGVLPAHFPRWLNVYDPRDFLGYRAEGIFGANRVRDVEVDNCQPFPASHSAYWSNEAVWQAVRHFLDEVSRA